ncbi:VWA domain-containing protein [Acidaminobacter sp. JC074]|uniref:VWA domain-containing protein n=1 Tax=Acidaminobacter sp. JC074 TaxID=2530199 RepID=UPI001F106FDA|nr:VWA domain-containing protein [Acidaminobacter sp. JC074]MCH4886046.1 VWA domain-containing protein [Acidaminobacter sp. JC074]
MKFETFYVLLMIPVVLYFFLRKNKRTAIGYSNVTLIKEQNPLKKWYKLGKYLVLAGCIVMLIALARPRTLENSIPLKDEGIAIGVLLDVSGSMESVDFRPNRLEVAKDTIESFIKERSSDKIALVPFAGNAFTNIPLTLDHEVLLASLDKLDVDSINEQGTAIGMSVSVGINRLKKSDAKSKVLVLVTDGDNNAGQIDPITASKLANDYGIKIYTIGVGTDKTILPYEVFGVTQYQEYEGGLNEPLLKEIAATTGGKYFRAKDEKTLENIFEEINTLEKSEVEQNTFDNYKEWAYPLMFLGIVMILIGLFVDKYYFIQIP